MTDQADKFAWWHEAVARKKAGYGRDLGLVHDGFPECGFYRRKRKDAIPSAVAIWPEDDVLKARESCDGRHYERDAQWAADQWTWLSKDPVDYDTYKGFYDTGVWPDMDEAVAAQVEARGIGDNQPADELETLKDQIESAKAGIAAYEEIGDDETLAKAQSLRSRLLELKGMAEKIHKREKEPHLKAGRDVDAKWLPLAKDAKASADEVRARMDAYETAKFKREQEERRKADEARRAAEQAAREAEAAGAPPSAPEPEPAPAPAPAPSAPIKGAYGRAATARTVKVVTEITDIDALLLWLKEHPEMVELARKLAQRAVDKDMTPPGVTVEEQRKVA